MLQRSDDPGNNSWRLQKWLQIGKERKLSRGIKVVEHFVFQCISLKQERLKEGMSFDFLTLYMENDDDGDHQLIAGLEISDKFLRDTAINLLAAWKDTINVSFSWFFWLRATHPLVENKIWEEIIKANNINREIKDDKMWWIFSAEEVRKLVYLHEALCETLRLSPPVPLEHKASIKADILPSGHKIGSDTEVMFSLYVLDLGWVAHVG